MQDDSSQLTQQVITFIRHHRLMTNKEPVVVGLSGGPDSLFLLHVLTTWKEPHTIIAAHLDHGWRAESATEVIFCAKVAEQLGVRFVSGHLNTYASHLKQRGSQEDLGRQARRLFFEDVARSTGAQTIALAHHADDRIETLFVRLIRGAGLQGLAGMQPHSTAHGFSYVRPLLEISKQEIVSFLNDHAMTYLTDPSNESPTYLRNRIRKNVIPALTQCDSRASTNIARALDHLAQADSFCEAQAQEALQRIIINKDGSRGVSISALKEMHPYLRNRVLTLWLYATGIPFTPTQSFFNECERFLFSSTKNNKHCIAPDWIIVKQDTYAFCKQIIAS